jgi:hypothetical protein
MFKIKFWHLAFGNFLHMGTIVFKKNLYSRVPESFYSFHLGDYAMILIILNQSDGIFLPSFDMTYRIHAAGVWSPQNKLNKIHKTLETLLWMRGRYEFKLLNSLLLDLYVCKLKNSLGLHLDNVEKFFYLPFCYFFVIIRNSFIMYKSVI